MENNKSIDWRSLLAGCAILLVQIAAVEIGIQRMPDGRAIMANAARAITQPKSDTPKPRLLPPGVSTVINDLREFTGGMAAFNMNYRPTGFSPVQAESLDLAK